MNCLFPSINENAFQHCTCIIKFSFPCYNKKKISVINGNVSPYYLATKERVLRNLSILTCGDVITDTAFAYIYKS